MNHFTRKSAYVWLIITEQTVNFIVLLYSIFFRKKKKREVKKIAAFWYCPPDQIGSNIRMGEWKTHFENDGFIFDNFYINNFQEGIEKISKGNYAHRYMYFALCMWRRLAQILKLHRYDVVWIGRSIIPFYPRKKRFY